MTELVTGRELAQKIYNQITHFPETHNQASWVLESDDGYGGPCNTTRCIAGWAVHFNMTDEDGWEGLAVDRLGAQLDILDCDRRWSTVAGGLLELDHENAERLFYEYSEADAVSYLKVYYQLEDAE